VAGDVGGPPHRRQRFVFGDVVSDQREAALRWPIRAGHRDTGRDDAGLFTGADSATLRYDFNGVVVTKAIRRQVFGARAATCRWFEATLPTAQHYQDLWWNPTESGWGLNITQQSDIVFATLFTYAEDQSPIWYVMSAGRRQPDGSFSGELYRVASGPPFNAQPSSPRSGHEPGPGRHDAARIHRRPAWRGHVFRRRRDRGRIIRRQSSGVRCRAATRWVPTTP
jgi:hypothetical protein